MVALDDDVSLPSAPVLIIALEGWIDAGEAAAAASSAIASSIGAETFGRFIDDDLLDLRARRPAQGLEEGVRRTIAWTEPTFQVGRDRAGAGIVLLVGPEPDYRWKAFADEVAKLAIRLGTRLVVNLGGFPAESPHTRPLRLAATASSDALARQIGFVAGSLDVPAGIADVIAAQCTEAGIPSIGLWARVPHYVAGMPFAPAALALVEGLSALADLDLDLAPLRLEADEVRRHVDELVAESDEHRELVQRLEAQTDEPQVISGLELGDIPSADEIAAELERYLRGEANGSP